MLKKAYTVVYPASSLKKDVEFFQKLLGIPPSYSGPSWADFKLGNIRTGLREDIKEPQLVFYVENVEKVRKELMEKGFMVGDIKDFQPFGREFTVETPGGGKILVFQPMNRKILEEDYFLGR